VVALRGMFRRFLSQMYEMMLKAAGHGLRMTAVRQDQVGSVLEVVAWYKTPSSAPASRLKKRAEEHPVPACPLG
jgi:hypothetical protein